MGISKKDMAGYFEIFDIFVDQDGSRLPCFKCSEDLFKKRRFYRCVNGHKYTYEQMLHEHASFMQGLLKDRCDGFLKAE